MTTPTVDRFTGGSFGQNCYLLTCPETREGVLVDPGAAVDGMLAAVADREIRILAILLTHAHVDHLDGVPLAKKATGAPIHLHRDAEHQYQLAPLQAERFGLDIPSLPQIDEYYAEGTVVRFGRQELEVRDTPGHAPGHVILAGGGIAMVGDCVFAGSIGRTDIPGGDLATLMRSIREKILSLPDETVLYAGHGPETTVGHERVSNPFLMPHFGGSEFA